MSPRLMDGDHGHGYVVLKMVMVKFITLVYGCPFQVKMVMVKIMTMVNGRDVPSLA